MKFQLIAATEGWHSKDLQRGAIASGDEICFLPFKRMTAVLGDEFAVVNGENGINSDDTILIRNVPAGTLEQVVYRMDVLLQLEAMGCRLINRPRAIECCVDKYLATTKLMAAGLPVPRTLVCEYADDAMIAFEALGADVVVKPLFGSLGKGMVRVSDPELAYRTFTTIERLGSVLYLQEFIEHPGWDLRVFVVGGRTVASMKRYSTSDWRTNVALGAPAESVILTDEEEHIAVEAANVVGAEVCGVDLLPGPDGTRFVIEANSVPGWRKLTEVSGIDIAAAILDYAKSG